MVRSMTRAKTSPRTSFASMHCSVAQALARIGDAWTLLILRDAFNGLRRFDELQRELGIATNVLADRLRRLTRSGILTRQRCAGDLRRVEYRLSRKGRDLHVLLVALAQWGERWVPDPRGSRVLFRDRRTGKPIARVGVRAQGGRRVTARDVVPIPGPGADAKLKRLFGFRDRKRGASKARMATP
jgi:DNA-binding HxlR family transcriptional regulator